LDIDQIIDQTITSYLAGAKQTIPELIRVSER
jgi:hypothetical protein